MNTENTTNASQTQVEKRRNPRTKTGIVVSDKMNKTIVVKLTRRVLHKKYKKYITKSKKVMAHDENSLAKINDEVLIVEEAPRSKQKHYALKKVLRKAVNV